MSKPSLVGTSCHHGNAIHSLSAAEFASCTCRMMILLPRSPADVLYAELLMLSNEFVSMCNSVDSNSRTQSDSVWMIGDEFWCR